MGGWVAWMCAMMLAVLLFVGRAGVCVDGCRAGSCIDAGWVDVCSEVVLDSANSFSGLRRGGGVAGWEDGWEDGRIGGGWEVGSMCTDAGLVDVCIDVDSCGGAGWFDVCIDVVCRGVCIDVGCACMQLW